MQPHQEQRISELVVRIADLADCLPNWTDEPPEGELQIFEALQDAAEDLWALWREKQIEIDIAA